MQDTFQSYISLLDVIRDRLAQLTELARNKNSAVRCDDLETVDNILRQEQALALTFRGLEQKRQALLQEMGVGELPLSQLAGRFPEALRPEAKRAAEALKDQYSIYQAAAEVARITLECSLHEIEKVLHAAGFSDETGPGYTPPGVEAPRAMKTDFRA